VIFESNYFLFVFLPLIVISGAASLILRSAYSKYSHVASSRGVTGAQAAEIILRSAGIYDVRVAAVQGWLSDHYSPREKVLRLSPKNYAGSSIAALGVAAHEAGHAIQHATGYAPLKLRNAAVPLASAGSSLGYVVLFIGLFMSYGHGAALNPLTLLGLGLIAGVVVFQLITLPVEFDASRRALQVLPQTGILTPQETKGARNVLAAAALTYVAAAIVAILELLYWAWRLGLLSGSSRD
jgi:Zn-dependent membrane protease YugP